MAGPVRVILVRDHQARDGELAIVNFNFIHGKHDVIHKASLVQNLNSPKTRLENNIH